MNAFDLMAEAKIRQWQQEIREGTASPSRKTEGIMESAESLEAALLRDTKCHIVKAYMHTGTQRAKLLCEAEKMQIQLASRLERSGYNHLSKLFSDQIQFTKANAEAATGDIRRLAQLLKEVE